VVLAVVPWLPGSPWLDTMVSFFLGSATKKSPLKNRSLISSAVLLVDAGRDIQSVNSTVPLYSPRTNEDPNIVLDYEVDLYAPGSPQMVKNWYELALYLI
jgi:hypothetical protein